MRNPIIGSSQPTGARTLLHWRSWLVVVLAIGIYSSAFAGAVTDASLGHSSQTLSGQMTITQQMGMLSGNNLFHSFQTFNIAPGESANFTTSTSGIQNVISRVTGGSLSLINGPITLTPASGVPNFFFINPAGVTFGTGASIDVPGAFHVSTADYLKFPDGNFYADLTKPSTFSSAAPEAFGFLGTNKGTITVNGGASLSTKPGQPISIVAGDIEISDAKISSRGGGDIRVVALGQSAQEVGFSGLLPAAYGNLSINGGSIFTNTNGGANAGDIKVNAGSISIDGKGASFFTGISSQTKTSTGKGGSVEVTTTGNLSIINGGMISSDTQSSGDAGPVKVNVGSITIDGKGASVFTGILGQTETSTGKGGSVEVTTTGNLSIINGGAIASYTRSSGDAGSVKVNAGSIIIDGKGASDFTGIASQTGTASQMVTSTGNGGSLEVTTTGRLSLINGGYISTNARGKGKPGDAKVNAGSITIDGSSSHKAGITSVSVFNGASSSGNVEVTTTGELSIINGGSISSNTNGYEWANAGDIKVNAGSITIDGQGHSSYWTGIFSDTWFGTGEASGNAGTVQVSATGSLSITNAGTISSSTYGYGSAGSVKVNASTLLVDGDSSSIRASASGYSGLTGSVNVIATDSITLSNGGKLSIDNRATAASPSSLTPTLLSVSAPNITLKDGQITAASTDNVAASNIRINFTNRLSLDSSTITTSSNLGNGGSITIKGGNAIFLDNSQITTSVSGQAGNGGDINVSAAALAMNTGFIQANTAASNASGGLVGIDVHLLVPSGNTLFVGGQTPYTFQSGVSGFNAIQAAAPTGVSGAIHITSPALDISGSLGGLSAQVIDTGGLGRSPCQTTGGSSLAQTGRGGLPPSAGGLLRADPVLSPNGNSANSNYEGILVASSNWECM